MKKQLAKLALTAALGLALTLLACEDKEKKQTPTETQQPSQEAAAEKVIEVVKGSFTDTRDNKTYKTVKIGEQVWMAENLNYETESSMCYDKDPANCQKYGRLYDWGTALSVCPSGWHLPSKDEWQTLVDLDKKAGKYLKAKSGWENNGNGTDNYGFSALPGGQCGFNCETDYGGCTIGNFSSVGHYGNWWTATECEDCGDSEGAYTQSISDESVINSNNSSYSSGHLLSVRCIKD